MKNLKTISSVFTALAMMFVMSTSHAITFQFENITHNGNTDLTGTNQLTVDVTETLGGDVNFTFWNNVGVNSSITSIYFDLGTTSNLFSQFSIDSSSSGVTFALNTLDPSLPQFPNLPGGNTINFDADVAAESAGSPTNGVDTSEEYITFLATADSGYTTFDNFIALMMNGDFRTGFHLTAIDDTACFDLEGSACGSDSYVSAIPVPAAAWLFGTALFGFFATSRRKKNS